MPHPFGNDRYRFGSARFVGRRELKRAGFFRKTPTALFTGFFEGCPLFYDGDGGVLITAGARSGKLRDVLAYNICSGILEGVTLLVLDVKGELAAISQDQTPDGKFCLYWNPFGLHGLPQHRINPFGHLKWSSPTLFADMKVALESLLPNSGAANARYFELNARRIGEALGLTLVKQHGELTFPDLYDAILKLQTGGPAWIDLAYEMYSSGIPLCQSVEAEIAAAREDSSGGFKGILGEIQQAVTCLSDPVLRESLSPPFDASLADLCSPEQAYQLYMMCPPEMIEAWAGVLKAMFTGAMTLKARAPQAPKQTWIIDEAARLKGFEQIPRLFTDGAGIGIRPVAIFQDAAQMNDLAPNAERKISSSAALQIYFGIRDLVTAQRVSNMRGAETLCYDEDLAQSRARLAHQRLIGSAFNGGDPFAQALDMAQQSYEAAHQVKQRRMMQTPDEVLNMPSDRMYIRADGLSGPISAERAPYWTQRWMAGRFHPNPYHPPLDRVLVQTRFGPRWRPVLTRDVPERYAHFPQYRGGTWSFIGR